MRIALLWDIDGTLLSTARAGIRALEAAAREVAGADVDLSEMRTAGLTDGQIAHRILDTDDADLVQRFLRAYEAALPAALPTRQGQVMPGVEAILADLQDEPDVVSLLLTGNTEAGAAAKLDHYGLASYFAGGGGFCVDGSERSTIAERALALVGPVEQAYVIGDTPHDVAAAQAIGVRCLAVATGGATAAELEEAGAWRVLEQLPDPAAFRALIGL
jgi:phosphoglycolate phosphatase-like HAD superfamily hydrolase